MDLYQPFTTSVTSVPRLKLMSQVPEVARAVNGFNFSYPVMVDTKYSEEEGEILEFIYYLFFSYN